MAQRKSFVRDVLAVGLALLLGACHSKTTPEQAAPSFAVDCVTATAAKSPRQPRPTIPRVSYDPACGNDAACGAWRVFRQDHPYPYQAFAGKALGNKRAVLVVSEPPPNLGHDVAVELLRKMFADRAPDVDVRRWMIGSDGFVEDVVVSFDAPELAGDDLLASPELRDRIATLQLAWFGTACGGDVEGIGDGSALAQHSAPNLQIRASEVKRWLDDPKVTWLPIETQPRPAQNWGTLAAAAPTGAFLSNDHSLVLLTFPRAMVGDPVKIATLRGDFRRFAVSSDAILGLVWTPEEQVALVGRARTNSLAQIAPLRFETFQLLAAQRSNELLQSYERTNPLAGRMWAQKADWAPIFLSNALIDTEFGALLNVTDQMLKSWSESGTVNYLYFDYPLKPRAFPFEKPLSDLVAETTHSQRTLFNWNTAGSAVTVDTEGLALVVGRQLGSLPVTYGSDAANDGEMETGGQLVNFEDKAYDYFSGLGDPNLARVVQYTLIYQGLRSLEGDTEFGTGDDGDKPTLRPETRALAKQLETLLLLLPRLAEESGSSEGALGAALAKLAAIHASYAGLPDSDLAILLVDRQDGLHFISESGQRAIIGSETDEAAVKMRVVGLLRAVANLSVSLKDTLQRSGLEFAPIRQTFERASAHPVSGWIRTPSHVISWGLDPAAGISIGGHNINAKTLRFVQDDTVDGLVATEDGRVLYPASEADRVNARATEIARAVEHKRASPAELRDIASTGAVDRPRWQALGLRGEEATAPAAARLGGRSYADAGQFVENLRTLKAKVACCRIMGRDASGRSLIVETNPTPPPLTRVMGFGDNASLGMYLRRGTGKPSDVILFDQSAAHVDALLAGTSITSEPVGTIGRLRHWLGRGRDYFTRQFDYVVGKDLNGRFGALSPRNVELSRPTRMQRIGALRAETVRAAKVQALSDHEIGQMLESLNWSREVDGFPTAARLSYRTGANAAGSFDVVVGFRGVGGPRDAAQFRAAIDNALVLAADKEHPLLTVQMTIKNNLQRLRKAEVGRIVFVQRNGTDRMQITLFSLTAQPHA